MKGTKSCLNQFTLAGIGLLGPQPGAMPGEGAPRRVSGGRSLKRQHGPAFYRPTTGGAVRVGCSVVSDCSRGGGPSSQIPIGTWNVTSLVGKEHELVREVERY